MNTTDNPTPNQVNSRIDNIEIYIDPDGSVTFADLPLELASLVEDLGGPAPVSGFLIEPGMTR